MATHVERLRSQVGTFLPEAKEAFAEIGAQIEAKTEEMIALRVEQSEVRRLIRAFEPEFDKREYADRNGKAKKRSGAAKYSAAKIEDVLIWLKSNAPVINEGDGFYASELAQFPTCPVNQSGLSAILAHLHETGQVRLTKSSGQGGRKYFKVVI